jgi:hypothetical protein
MHPISDGEIFFHSDRVAAWTPGRWGTPNIRIELFGLCANTFDVSADIRASTTIPNHLDTAFLPSLSQQMLVRHENGFSNAVGILRRFNMLSTFKGSAA